MLRFQLRFGPKWLRKVWLYATLPVVFLLGVPVALVYLLGNAFVEWGCVIVASLNIADLKLAIYETLRKIDKDVAVDVSKKQETAK